MPVLGSAGYDMTSKIRNSRSWARVWNVKFKVISWHISDVGRSYLGRGFGGWVNNIILFILVNINEIVWKICYWRSCCASLLHSFHPFHFRVQRKRKLDDVTSQLEEGDRKRRATEEMMTKAKLGREDTVQKAFVHISILGIFYLFNNRVWLFICFILFFIPRISEICNILFEAYLQRT